MNWTRKKGMRSLAAIFVAIIVMASMVVPALAQQGPEIRVTDSEERADQPDVAVDSNGNVHIAYFDEYGTTYREIWYTMLDSSGNTLIDDTRISTDNDDNSKHPTIVVDSNDMVHILWAESRFTYEIWYTKLDPSQDDQNGDAADPAAITVVDDIALTDLDTFLTHPRMAVDSNDDIHIVWEEDWGEVHYMKIDNNGNVLVDTIHIRECSSRYGRPDVVVDSNDDVHVTWNDYEDTDQDEVYYMMLHGSDGSTLIDATLLTPDDDEKSKRQTIVVDAQDMVHIIWSDHRTPEVELFYTKLDPSLDDQDGDAADEGVITVTDDTMLTTDDGEASRAPQIAIQCGYIHVTWRDDRDGGINIYYMAVDTDGNIEVPETALTTSGSVTYSTSYFDNQPSLDVDSNGKAHTVWCDDRTEDYEVWYTSYDGPPCEAPPPPPPPPLAPVGVPTLSPWGAIGMIIALAGCIVWTLRKRRVSLNALHR